MKDFLKLSMHNKEAIKATTVAGCFHCCNVFPTDEIKEYEADRDTAICPKCSVDTVIPHQNITIEILQNINKDCFGHK